MCTQLFLKTFNWTLFKIIAMSNLRYFHEKILKWLLNIVKRASLKKIYYQLKFTFFQSAGWNINQIRHTSDPDDPKDPGFLLLGWRPNQTWRGIHPQYVIVNANIIRRNNAIVILLKQVITCVSAYE